METWTILLAAGQGTRLKHIAEKKQFLIWQGRPLFWQSARVFARVPGIHGVVFVFPPETLDQNRLLVQELLNENGFQFQWLTAPGGETRQDSVRSGLRALPGSCDRVLVHDAARPFITAGLVQNVLSGLDKGASGVVPGIPVTDTIKQHSENGLTTLDRSRLVAVQTPQGFQRHLLDKAHHQGRVQGWSVTDDASMLERLDHEVIVVQGLEENVKITTDRDLDRLQPREPAKERACTGWGYDVHRFGQGRQLKLGGIPITNAPQVLAHSDGDVVMHALMDALLGCLGQGDIGDHFPDQDPSFSGINSAILLAEVLDMTQKAALDIDHVDITIISQVPRLSPWKGQIRRNLAALMGLEPGQICIKATTEEGLGFTGEKKGIKTVAVVTARRPLETKGET
jgi:2-C-methyl-D-erythritol 4-phosphate cytidylyltransferase/2-C-methyl-D-erythritol 2,4-cyclodiphosphate synthase